MTNDNNHERENKMTLENYDVTNEELAAIELEEENWEELESDDGHRELYDEFIDYSVSLDETIDGFNQFDEERDLDFYQS